MCVCVRVEGSGLMMHLTHLYKHTYHTVGLLSAGAMLQFHDIPGRHDIIIQHGAFMFQELGWFKNIEYPPTPCLPANLNVHMTNFQSCPEMLKHSLHITI